MCIVNKIHCCGIIKQNNFRLAGDKFCYCHFKIIIHLSFCKRFLLTQANDLLDMITHQNVAFPQDLIEDSQFSLFTNCLTVSFELRCETQAIIHTMYR